MPAEIDANRLALLEPTMRTVDVLQFCSWSACTISSRFRACDEIRIDLVRLAGDREHHLQEVLAVGHVVARINERLSDGFLVAHRGNRRQLGHQPMDRNFDLVRIVRVERVLVESAQRPDDGTEDRHRMGVAREAVVERPHVFVQDRVPPQRLTELTELLGRWQLAVDQQVARFDEVALLGDDFYRIAAIAKDAPVAVEKGDGAGAGSGVAVALVQGDIARLAA